MENDMKELIKGMIYLKTEELGNQTMAFNSVETFINGLIAECEIEEMEHITPEKELEFGEE